MHQDAFRGSGSPMLAYQRVGHSSDPIEMAANYCALCLHRCQQYVTEAPMLESDGWNHPGITVERTQVAAEIARCHRELAQIETEIRNGDPDLQGLCLALSDWSAELRILEGQELT